MNEGLSRVSLSELRSLLRAIERDRLQFPLTVTELRASGLAGRAEVVCANLEGLDKRGAERALALLIAERELESRPELDLVWTGPEPTHATSRDTAVVVRQLFEGAERAVVLCGYSFDHGTEILAPLHTAMKERGVQARVFLDIPGKARPGEEAESYATREIDHFLARNWTFGEPLPEIYYDPRSAEPYSLASLHAKCVVVDQRRALVTSANFTSRGQDRNLEVGILIDDPRFGAQLASHLNGLVSAGLVLRYRG